MKKNVLNCREILFFLAFIFTTINDVETEHLCVEHIYVLDLVLLKTTGNNTPGSLFSSQNPSIFLKIVKWGIQSCW